MKYPELLWLARHAETATPSVFHGQESDIHLSQLGEKQAEAAAEWFAALNPTVVVSSTMKRAVQTAEPIARLCNLPHLQEPGLHERRVGILGGSSFSNASGPWAETIQQWTQGNTGYTTEGAESFDEIALRVTTAWERVVQQFPGERVVVIAHGVVCKVLLLSLLPDWNVSGWTELGRVPNLAVSGLSHGQAGWQADPLLHVPPNVARLTEGIPTGVGEMGKPRSEA